MHTGGKDRLKSVILAHFRHPWTWPWHRIGSCGIPSRITHQLLPVYHILLKSD